MIDARFIPIDRWPKLPTLPSDRKVATFRASYADTIELLERELDKINARQVTISAYFDPRDIRADGWPRRDPVPTAPGVILSFGVLGEWDAASQRRKLNELSFPCDTFTTFDDNLRAIALVLEALRKIDRYGVTPGHEQYKGWARLESGPVGNGSGDMTRDEALAFIRDHIRGFAGSLSTWNEAYRVAAAKLHPDNRMTGNHELFVKLQQAKEILERS